MIMWQYVFRQAIFILVICLTTVGANAKDPSGSSVIDVDQAPKLNYKGERIPNTSAPNGSRSRSTNFENYEATPEKATPAWAKHPMAPPVHLNLPPFCANLFQGNFSNTYDEGGNNDYLIIPGDRIHLRMWGIQEYDGVHTVDIRGNIFIPEIGPVKVAGLRNSELMTVVKKKITSIFKANDIKIYLDLLSTQPVAVYVTGMVNNPGRYAGGPSDSVLYFLDKAGGIDPNRGSYRSIIVLRGNKKIAEVDLYHFVLNGVMPGIRLKDGDVILVEKKKSTISVIGLVLQQARYEFKKEKIVGRDLIDLVAPRNNVSHVKVTGTRKNTPFSTYLSFTDFDKTKLCVNDIVEFRADIQGTSLMVGVTGSIGPSRYTIHQGTKLKSLLSHVPVNTSLANLKGIYIQRRSVAEQQKDAIIEALRRLEQSSLTATSSSENEAGIRVKEAGLIQDFVKRARSIEPEGIVVVYRNGKINDLLLEDGDMVVIPVKSNVVQITGEVMIPNSVVYSDSLSLKDYINSAGGYSERADKSNILVVKPNGEVGRAKIIGIGPGDQLLVMPRVDSKNVQMAKDLTQILYQIAVATKVALLL